MKAVRFAFRSLGRELRSGEVLVLLFAVTLAVAALTAVGFLTDRIGRAVERQANEILAADLRLRSPEPIPETWFDAAGEYGLQAVETQNFPSVVFAGDESSIANIKGVDDGYPLRGTLRISQQLFGDEQEVETIPEPGTVWIEGSLLARLGIDVGATIAVGELDVTVTNVLTYRPDQSVGFASMAPTVLINLDDLPRTGLITVGSRVGYALLVAGEPSDVDDFYDSVEDELPDSVRIRNQEDSAESADNASARAKRFLSLTAVISLLLSAVAIAMSARRFAHRRMDTVALMKSLGASQGFVITAATVQLIVLGIIGLVLGSVIGFLVERAVMVMLADIIRGELPAPSMQPVFLASGSALVLLLGFAMPSLLQLRNTPPLRVLRHDEMPPQPSRLLVVGMSLAAVTVMLYNTIGDMIMLVIVLGGMTVVSMILYFVGRLMVSGLGKSRGGVGIAWRYGLANVARRGRGSAVQIVAFGLGLTVLLLLTFVRTDLLTGWQQTLDEDAPNQFMFNVQKQEREPIAEIFVADGLEAPEFVPMVRARMSSINGVDVKDIEFEIEGGEWMANREHNLSWASELSDSNEIVDGEWWGADYSGEPLLSVEAEAAMELGVEVGDVITFNIAGEMLDITISSTREVNWDSFQPNFFMVLSPGVIEEYPATFVAAMNVPSTNRSTLRNLVRTHPTVSVVDLETILAQVRSIIEKATLAVQAVFVFTLAAGIAVLFAAVQSTIDERRFESAMLRALGVRRRTVLSGVLAEFASLGAAAGLLAAVGATVLAYLVADLIFELPYTFNPTLMLAGLIGGIGLVCLSGYIAARGAINAPPVDVLRGA